MIDTAPRRQRPTATRPPAMRPPATRAGLAFARELVLAVVVTFAYFLTRGLIRGRTADAFLHARQLLAVERAAHLAPEAAVQVFASQHDWLVDAANIFYLVGHLPVLVAVAIWLYWWRPRGYAWFRAAFLCAAAIGLVVYVAYPVAPPRFLPGFVDTLKSEGINLDGSAIALFYNPFAAMPSLHVGWAALAGGAMLKWARPWWVKTFGAALPLLMAAAVLITGNHYLLDVLAGAGVALIAGGVALLVSWRPRRAPARSDADPPIGLAPVSEVPVVATTSVCRESA